MIQLDPISAYDRLSPVFQQISDRRRAYLNRIEQLVIGEIPFSARSLLDIGAGDGTRALRIARQRRLRDVILLEPSAVMRSKWPVEVHTWPIPAEELHRKNGQFDVITCLWNVLGHIAPRESRVELLKQIRRLLSPSGSAFIDISHRYNVRHYGILPILLRAIRDRLVRDDTNGDVRACWDIDGVRFATNGHVFTHSEFQTLAHGAGLHIKKSYSVDYATGQIHKSMFSGHLFYVLQSAIASSKAEQTWSI